MNKTLISKQFNNKTLLNSVAKIIEMAFIEDNIFNDITSDLTIDKSSKSKFQINARQDLIFCGEKIFAEIFSQLKKSQKFSDCEINFEVLFKDGESVKKSQNILEGYGNDNLILAAERVMLNLIQHLCAIATHTNKFVTKLNNQSIKILDTRKTLPNLRELQKYAVICGGGFNHRFSLADLILIKDNHINSCGGVEQVFEKIKNSCSGSNNKIEIECDNFIQVSQAIKYKPDIIMLDNMDLSELKKSIELIRSKYPQIMIEISGGISLENISKYSCLDIDFISIGSLTNSCQSVDIGLDFL